jgi:hypothetical protein
MPESPIFLGNEMAVAFLFFSRQMERYFHCSDRKST